MLHILEKTRNCASLKVGILCVCFKGLLFYHALVAFLSSRMYYKTIMVIHARSRTYYLPVVPLNSYLFSTGFKCSIPYSTSISMYSFDDPSFFFFLTSSSSVSWELAPYICMVPTHTRKDTYKTTQEIVPNFVATTKYIPYLAKSHSKQSYYCTIYI